MIESKELRSVCLSTTAIAGALILATPAAAQDAHDDAGLAEIIVTAQKREQSVMDVPVAVSAITGDALVANRVVNVTDLSSIAPGVTVRVTAGGSQLPSFTIRGAVSYGVVPGSDKQVSVYLDGVYISAPRGSIFDLPDIERIEMLRGPQGTLFGRNATAGAVSIATREPKGEGHVKASVSVANQHGRRYQISADTPQIGPFSAYFSYVHNYRRGDIRNARPGQVWNRSASLKYGSNDAGAMWLGTKDADSFFGSLKFETGNFKTVYRYDNYKAGNRQTPEATAFVGVNASAPGTGAVLAALISSQATPVLVAADGKRPEAVDNSWVVPSTQTNQGHSLTSTLDLGKVQIKNIAAFRKSFIYGASSIDGLSTLPFTAQMISPYAQFIAGARGLVNASTPPAQAAAIIGQIAAGLVPLVGQPFAGIAAQTSARSRQWSDELQINYDSDLLTLTAGGMWFKSSDYVNEHGLSNNLQFAPVPGGIVGLALNLAKNKAKSIAGYAQAEIHVLPQLDVIAGGRYTKDKKTSNFSFGNVAAPNVINSRYSDSQFNYLVGLNYKPNDDMLVYAKYSTAYVSGGSTAGIDFAPEKAKSAEAGIKSELLDGRLRASLALFWAKYTNYQSAQGASTFGSTVGQLLAGKLDPALIPSLISNMGTFVLGQGDVKARGFEFDLTAAPVQGLTVGGNLSYTNTNYANVPALLLGSLGIPTTQPQNYRGPYRPKWTASAFAQYDTQPLFGDAYLSLRTDANFQSTMPVDANANRGIPAFAIMRDVPSYWIVNGRAALRDVSFGPLKGEIAVWGKNLFDEDKMSFGLINGGFEAAAYYIAARSYGLDLTIEF